MDFAGCESIACNDRVVHEYHFDSKSILLCEDAICIWLRSTIGSNNRQPSRPHVVREAQDLLICVPLVLTDSLDRWKPVARHVFVLADSGDALCIGRFGLLLGRLGGCGRSTATNSSLAHDVNAGSDQSEDEKD